MVVSFLSEYIVIASNVCYFLLDVDECSSSNVGCHANAFCQNTVGSYTCACNPGYSGNGFTCNGTLLFVNKTCYNTVETS